LQDEPVLTEEYVEQWVGTQYDKDWQLTNAD
jgi:hypothetical protein